MDYTAVGQTTHLAARMEQLADPGLDPASPPTTLRLAEGYVQVKPLGPVAGQGPARSRSRSTSYRAPARCARGCRPRRPRPDSFVGRDAELEQLRRRWSRAAAATARSWRSSGEPGVGKSRLFWEFTHSHRTQGWLVLESGSVSYGKATAYLPVIDLLKAYFRIERPGRRPRRSARR